MTEIPKLGFNLEGVIYHDDGKGGTQLSPEQYAELIRRAKAYEGLVEALRGVNQCFKCKYGYSQNELTCPGEADAELPCAGYVEEYEGKNFIEAAIKQALAGEPK